MAIFKKLIVSGSNAHLNHVSASIFSGSFTGNGSGLTNLLSASYALTASYAMNGGGTLPSGLISSSLQFQNSTSPFTGSFRGDGSGLTEINSSSYALTASFTKPIVISPSEFGSDQHNYNPTGFTNSSFVRISGTDKIYSITGFSSTGIESGISKKIANIGTSSICLVGLHPSSSAANQICTGYNFMIAPKTFVEILYDGDLQKWLINGQSKQPDIYYEWAADFDPNTGLPWLVSLLPISSGQIAEISSSNSLNLPDGLLIDTLSSTTGGGLIILPGYSQIKKGQSIGNTFVSSILNIDILSDGTDRFVTILAISSGAFGVPYFNENNTIGIRYSDNINSGKWQFYAINNSGTTTTVDTGITVNSRQMYNLRIELDEIGENAYSYIDGIMTGMITGINLLPVTGSDMFPRVEHVKTAGTDSRKTSVHSMKVGIYTK